MWIYVTGLTKTDQIVTRTEIQTIKPNISDTLMHCPEVRISYLAIDSQVCFYRQLFSNPVKLCWCITGPVGPLGSTNQNWLGAKLLPMAILIYPVVCVHSCCLLRTQHHCLWPNGREDSSLAWPPNPTTPAHSPPPTHPPPYKQHLRYYRGCKNYLKNQQWILHSRVSYETVAIRLLYLYSKSGMATM